MARVRLTHTDTQSQKNTRTRGPLTRKQEKTVERSNDYAPDLLTLYFIITVEKKNTLPHCFLVSLPLSFIHFWLHLLFLLLILSLSEMCKHNTTFLKLIPVVNKGISLQEILRDELHEQHAHRREGGMDTDNTCAIECNPALRHCNKYPLWEECF